MDLTTDLTTGPSVVALGGGHGLAASLSALRQITANLTAVVTVADNGGSSGRLRDEFGVLPPGDLRMALAALCGDDEWGQTWARVLQHRFTSSGELHGHAVGNLLIVALWELCEQTGDGLVDGLNWVGRLLGARGRVLPMALTPLDITAQVRGVDPAAPYAVTSIRGQVEVATTAGEVLSVSLDPEVSQACPAAVAAVDEADYVILGPGSWYSSVVPHLLVPDLRNALVRTSARLIVTMNLEAQAGETEGYTPEDHLAVLLRQAPDLHIDTVLVDPASAPEHDRLRSAVEAVGAALVLANVAAHPDCGQHDPAKLAHAYALAMKSN